MLQNRLAKTIILLIGILLVVAGCGTKKEKNEDADNSEPVIPSHIDYHEDDSNQIVAPQNELGFKLLPLIDADDDYNLFISPTSLFMALSMVYNGADGITKEEMAEALQAQGLEIDDLNKASAALLTSLHDKKAAELNIANSIWLNEKFNLEENIQKNVSDHFNARVEEINIEDPASADKINEWVEKATNDKITDMADSPLDQNLVAMLLNAIYFKGDWIYEFDSDLTEFRDFQTGDSETIQVPLMQLEEELNYLENADFQAVELPYTDNEMSMHVFLPKEESSLDEFTKSLTIENWDKWQREFTNTEGMLMLPKFELDYEVILNDPLIELGMETAFHRNAANFSNMVQEDEQLFISKVKQKSYVKVNEEGTEAAAATSVEVVMESYNPNDSPFQMIVDRPFFFTITDNETRTILFMGSISNPPEIEE